MLLNSSKRIRCSDPNVCAKGRLLEVTLFHCLKSDSIWQPLFPTLLPFGGSTRVLSDQVLVPPLNAQMWTVDQRLVTTFRSLQSDKDEVILAAVRSLHKIFSLLLAQGDLQVHQPHTSEIPEGMIVDENDLDETIRSISVVSVQEDKTVWFIFESDAGPEEQFRRWLLCQYAETHVRLRELVLHPSQHVQVCEADMQSRRSFFITLKSEFWCFPLKTGTCPVHSNEAARIRRKLSSHKSGNKQTHISRTEVSGESMWVSQVSETSLGQQPTLSPDLSEGTCPQAFSGISETVDKENYVCSSLQVGGFSRRMRSMRWILGYLCCAVEWRTFHDGADW